MAQAQAEQHAQQAEMHVHLLQEANASLASERSTLLQRAVTAERALGAEREALVHRALTAEQATCALMEQHARDAAASSRSWSTPVRFFPASAWVRSTSESCTVRAPVRGLQLICACTSKVLPANAPVAPPAPC